MRHIRALLVTVALAATCAAGAPAPGIGLLVKAEDLPALREKIAREPWSGVFAKLKQRADEALTAWPTKRDLLAPHLDTLLDLSVGHAKVPSDPAARDAGKTLSEFALRSMCPAAFVYLVTGERKYADLAHDVLLHMGRVNRWGWFPWSGAHMPQIHSGMHFRNAAFTLDFIWDALTEEQRRAARDIIAEKAVEPYYRIVLFSPAMGLHHLRSKNQGNNVLAGALIACLALGEDYPSARRWRRSYIQTFHWIVTHDIGWAGQGLESGLPGYWSVSMQNLYTAATCLYNATGVDLRVHPAFMEATYYPVYHETTVPPVRRFTTPIDPSFRGSCGIIAGKPIELPHTASGGPWWYDYAGRFPESQATYFINRTMVGKDRQGRIGFRLHGCHQHGHSDIIGLLWTQPSLYRPDAASPAALFKTTDRMSMIRSGYGMGHTYLYFNGDVFLSALGEILCTTSGLAWHYKWHGWQKAETGIETEGEPLAPSMVVKESWHDEGFTFVHAAAGPSNIRYYPPPGQNECYKRYRRRERDILYVRDGPGADYFVFVDRVAQDDPRWHGWLWQSWNSVHGGAGENCGRYRVEADRRVRLERPNADLMIDFVAPKEVAFETESAPGQPIVSYMYDHNVLTLRALAGGCGGAGGERIAIPPSAWKGPGRLCRREELGPAGPDAAYRLAGARQIKDSGVGFQVAAPLQPGMRYRMRLTYRKQDLKVYENLAWQIDIELLDAKGNILARDTAPHDDAKPRGYNRPGSFRLTDTRSLTPTTPWIRTEYVHFDVPANARVSQVRGRLSAATWSHPPSKIHEKSVLDLGAITIEPVGKVRRRKAETFVTVVSPVRKGAAGPSVVRREAEGAVTATISREGRADHHVVLGGGRAVTLAGGSITADLAVLREGAAASLFARAATSIALRGRKILHSSRGVDVSLRMAADGSVTRAKVKADGPTKLLLAGRGVTLGPGLFVTGADGKFAPDPGGAVLETNAPASQKLLEAGLRPLIAECIAERDAYTRKGLTNVAPGAKVTASATRDPRFAPARVIDNKTWEYPTNGVLDYTQGDLRTSPSGGYGRGRLPLSGENMSVWPFYVRPTYWLLPYGQTGWIELELPREETISLVRLLNTSNAGLNDYAAVRYRVELRNTSGEAVARRAGAFGERFDRPFRQAFKYPKLFASYGDTFRGMLEPGVPVPFGDGWHDVAFGPVRARFVRVHVDSFWAVGGGLNEIQVYSASALRRGPRKAAGRPPSAAMRKPASGRPARAARSADGGPGPFGIASSGESFGDHARLFPLLREAGVTMVRSFPEWASFQPERGKWDFSAADALLDSARKNRVQIAGVFMYLAPWASSAAPGETDHGKRTRTFPIKDMRHWRDYVRGVLARYHKDVKYWEVYNEFNSSAFARNAAVKDYVEMVRQACEVAKEVDPQCKIGIGCADVDISFLQQAIAQGAAGHFDFVNVHPYSLMAAVMDGREPVFLRMATNLRKMLAKADQRQDIDLWVSEIGVASTNKPEAERKQAEAIAKACTLCLAQGVDRVFWFEGRGPAYGPGGDFGIVRSDWTKRPSFRALRTLTGLLGPRPRYLGWLNPTGRSYGFVFRGGAGAVLVTWAAGDEGDTLRFPAAVTVTDLAAKAVEVKAQQGIPLSRAPVFITDLPKKQVAEAGANHDRPLPWLRDYSAAKSVSCRMGAANVESGLAQLEKADGKTVAGLVDGAHVRRTDMAGKSLYVYFDVDDSYVSVGDNEVEITVVARRVDVAKAGGCNLTYESTKGYRQTGEWWTVPARPGWHEHTFRVKDANFANNWGWNFRIAVVGSPGDIWVRKVTVKRVGAKQ